MADLEFGSILYVLAAVLAAALVLVAVRRMRRMQRRRRRTAVQDAGLKLAFDACAPEGGDPSLEPFRLGRLRSETLDGPDLTRHQ
ncbi:hypothetical protein NX774_09540 [Massilia agilis]|uniref:Uncharacterized protein n=1 Tax=Massilia agilis TaxID=1811226 RepID=A0ABT2DA27_9BURK|nr:hypothetical protein [Massilia agilis]MCS0808160.1 hypothetical protein [Massilia agilis]